MPFYFFFAGKTDWFIGTELLPNKQFPIIFQSVKGSHEKVNFSWQNKAEIDMVIKYIRKLLDGKWNGEEVHFSNIVKAANHGKSIINSETKQFFCS